MAAAWHSCVDRLSNPMVFPMEDRDIPSIVRMEQECFGRMAWSARDFEAALSVSYDYPLVIRRGVRHPAASAHNFAGEEQAAPIPCGTSIPSGVAAYAVLRILGPEAELENICVSRLYRGEGLGRRLMEAILTIAARQRVEKIFLEVRKGNHPAIRLYESFAFRQVAIRKNYYWDPEEDAIVMQCETMT